MKNNKSRAKPGQPSDKTAKPLVGSMHAEIEEWLKKVKFRKKLVGGVDEADVWRKIEQLDSMYAEALKAERLRYNGMLAQQKRLLEEKLKHD